MSTPSFLASAAWTPDSPEPDSGTSDSVNQTRGAAPSSPQGSPECQSQRTCETFKATRQGAMASHQETAHPALSGPGGYTQVPFLLISSAAVSHAKTSPSPESAPGSLALAPDSSTNSCESQTSLFGPVGMSSLRTYPDSFHLTQEEISPSFSRRWPSSGFWTAPGECWTAVTSECHSDGGASSSLRDVLEDSVAPKYFLSPRAAAEILRRAEKRGKKLPERLEAALKSVAGLQTQKG